MLSKDTLRSFDVFCISTATAHPGRTATPLSPSPYLIRGNTKVEWYLSHPKVSIIYAIWVTSETFSYWIVHLSTSTRGDKVTCWIDILTCELVKIWSIRFHVLIVSWMPISHVKDTRICIATTMPARLQRTGLASFTNALLSPARFFWPLAPLPERENCQLLEPKQVSTSSARLSRSACTALDCMRHALAILRGTRSAKRKYPPRHEHNTSEHTIHVTSH